MARLQPYEFSGDQREELLNSAELVWRWESNFGGEGDGDEGGGDGGGRGRGRERGGVNTAAEAATIVTTHYVLLTMSTSAPGRSILLSTGTISRSPG